MIPHIRFYTTKFVGRADATTRMFFVLIKPEFKDDQRLLAHELEHVKQGWFTLFIGHALLYRFSKKYRYWSELMAFRKQISMYPEHQQQETREYFADVLANNYGLNKDPETVLTDLGK